MPGNTPTPHGRAVFLSYAREDAGAARRVADALTARPLHPPLGENLDTAKSSATWFLLRGDPRFEALINDPKNNAPLF